MVHIIASRAAGLRLVWIVLVLLIPIGVLGAFLTKSLERDIDVVKRQQQGSQYVRLLMPVFLDAAGGKSNPDHLKALATNGEPLAAGMEIVAAYRELVRLASSVKPNYAAVVSQIREQLRIAGDRSGLILDAYPETYYLSYVVTQSAPNLMSDFLLARRSSAASVSSSDTAEQRLVTLSMVVGGWREAVDGLLISLRSAASASSDRAAYRAINDIGVEIGSYVGDVIAVLRQSARGGDEIRGGVNTALSNLQGHFIEDLGDMWQRTQTRLDQSLEARADHLVRNMRWMLLGSFLAAIIGMGSAISMFKSTLTRLDEVEAARKQADSNRAEAEAMASRLETINSEIANLNVDLTDKVRKLKEAQDELLKKGRLEQLGQLTATVAHELRNPMGAVRTSSFLLERKIAGKGLGVEQQLQRISNGIIRCDNIITQLLDFSRSSKPQFSEVNLDDWLAKTVEEEAERLPNMVQIELAPGLDGRVVSIDGSRLSRCIINLMSNASEAMVGKGDDPAKFTTQEPKIVIETALTERGVEISVRDNGPGISEDNKKRILEPLFTTKNFGTGLGLPAVQRILEQHGGGLDIASVEGQGATFTAWLPTAQRTEAAA